MVNQIELFYEIRDGSLNMYERGTGKFAMGFGGDNTGCGLINHGTLKESPNRPENALTHVISIKVKGDRYPNLLEGLLAYIQTFVPEKKWNNKYTIGLTEIKNDRRIGLEETLNKIVKSDKKKL